MEREPEPEEEKGSSGVQEDLEKYRDLIEGGVEANPGELEAVEDSQVDRSGLSNSSSKLILQKKKSSVLKCCIP